MLALLVAVAPLCLHAGPPDALTLEAEELEAVPAFATGSLAALPLLPGASPLLFPLAPSSMRGLQPASTGFFFDGVRLPYALHLFAGPPVVQEGAVERLTVERGAPPVDRGRLLGGTVDLAPRRPRRHGPTAELSMDLLRAGALGGWSDEGHQVMAGASALWTPAIYGRTTGGGLQVDLGDYFLRSAHSFGATEVRLLALGAVDRFRSESETDLLGASLSFHRVDLRVRTPMGEGTWEAAATYGWDDGGAALGGETGRQSARVVEQLGGVRGAWSSLARGWGTVQLGFDVERRAATLTQRWTAQAPLLEGETPGDPPVEHGVRHPVANALLGGVHAGARVELFDDTFADLGVRGDLWQLDGHPTLFSASPRLGLAHGLDRRVRVHAGAALVHQSPTFLVYLPGAELAALRFGLQRAVRTEAGLTLLPRGRWTVRIDGWFDRLLRTVELGPLDRDFLQTVRGDPAEVTARHASRGTAWGAEVLVRRELGQDWFGWLTAGLQQSAREVRYPVRNAFGEPVDQRVDTLPSPLERMYSATLFAGRRWGRWTVSGAGRLAAGTLEAGGLGSTPQRAGLDRLRPGPRWIEADRDDWRRLPPSFRLDARVACDFQLGAWDLTASLDVQNVTAGREVTGYRYTERAPSLEAEAAGARTLEREPTSRLPGVPLPTLGLRARY